MPFRLWFFRKRCAKGSVKTIQIKPKWTYILQLHHTFTIIVKGLILQFVCLGSILPTSWYKNTLYRRKDIVMYHKHLRWNFTSYLMVVPYFGMILLHSVCLKTVENYPLKRRFTFGAKNVGQIDKWRQSYKEIGY